MTDTAFYKDGRLIKNILIHTQVWDIPTLTGDDQSSIIDGFEVFEQDGGFVPAVDVVEARPEVQLHHLLGLVPQVGHGNLQSSVQRRHRDLLWIDAKTSSDVYATYPILSVSEWSNMNERNVMSLASSSCIKPWFLRLINWTSLVLATAYGTRYYFSENSSSIKNVNDYANRG